MSHWTINEETDYLVFRDTATPNQDFRVAFFPNQYKDFGTAIAAHESGTVKTFTKWTIKEENGVLVFRDTFTQPGDHRYAFFPGCGNANNWHGGTVLYNQSETLLSGTRWKIAVEGGILVFRDTLSPGDHRYAFWPGQYKDM